MREFWRDYGLETMITVAIGAAIVAIGALVWSDVRWERRATVACAKAGGMLVRTPQFTCAKVEPLSWSIE